MIAALAGLLAKPAARWLIGGIAAVVVALVLAYVAYGLRQGGREAERAATNERALKAEERMKDADARGPRSGDDVDKLLRGGKF